jgi:hypothetical protein
MRKTVKQIFLNAIDLDETIASHIDDLLISWLVITFD